MAKQKIEFIENHFLETDYDIIVTDARGRKFELFYAGNQDLFFSSCEIDDESFESPVEQFVLENDSSMIYKMFAGLLETQDKNPMYLRNLNDGIFLFPSDDGLPEEKSFLEIFKDKSDVIINLIKGKEKNYPSVCFNTSRSSNDYVVMEFMDIYNNIKKAERQKRQLLEQKTSDEKEGQPWLDLGI